VGNFNPLRVRTRRVLSYTMTDSMHIHQHLGKQDGNSKENPPRAHVERTRDVFKESKPAAEDEDTHKESKMQSRRAEQPVVRTKSHKRKSAEAKEKEELSTDEQRSKDLAEHEVNITYSNYYYGEPRLQNCLILSPIAYSSSLFLSNH
jgi:hypothetical protein